jgi:hypothetical protein
MSEPGHIKLKQYALRRAEVQVTEDYERFFKHGEATPPDIIEQLSRGFARVVSSFRDGLWFDIRKDSIPDGFIYSLELYVFTRDQLDAFESSLEDEVRERCRKVWCKKETRDE